MIFDVGDVANLSTVITTDSGVPVNTPNVTLTVTRPDGTTASPAVTNTGAGGIYTASVAVDAAGIWMYVWAAAGTVVAAHFDQFTAQAQRPLIASLSEVKKQLNRSDSTDDDELRDYLAAATDVVEYLIEGPVAPQEFTEQHLLKGDRIAPRKRPLVSVTSLTPYEGSALDSDLYVPLLDINVIRLPTSLRCGWYTLVYRAGLTQVPARYRLAGKIIVQHLWQTQNGGGGRVLPGEDTLVPVPGMGFSIPARAMDLLGATQLGGFA